MYTPIHHTSSTPAGLAFPYPPQPKLCYYITRSNGKHVPLIPADELPTPVRLHGVPRELNTDQTFGLHLVGVLPHTGLVFKPANDTSMQHAAVQTREPSPPPMQNNLGATDECALDTRSSQINSISTSTNHTAVRKQSPPAHELATSWRKAGPDSPQAVVNAILGTESSAKLAAQVGSTAVLPSIVPPSGKLPDHEKKKYCTHWIRHGECDYTQQGCRFKHEMPDKAILQEIGFRTTPRWWLEKNQPVKPLKFRGYRASASLLVKPSEWLKVTKAASKGAPVPSSEGSASGHQVIEPTEKGGGSKQSPVGIASAAKRGQGTTTDKPPADRVESHPKPARADLLIDFDEAFPAPPSELSAAAVSSVTNDFVAAKGQPRSSEAPIVPPPAAGSTFPGSHFVASPKTRLVAANVGKGKDRSPPQSKPGTPPQTPLPQKGKDTGGLMASKFAVKEPEVAKSGAQSVQKAKTDGGLMASKHAVQESEIGKSVDKTPVASDSPRSKPAASDSVASSSPASKPCCAEEPSAIKTNPAMAQECSTGD